MKRLADRFNKVVFKIGMEELMQPVFYNSPVGIRFEIGGKEAVYGNGKKPNPAYVSGALKRADAIYSGLAKPPDILRMNLYPEGKEIQEELGRICKLGGLPMPEELICQDIQGKAENEEDVSQMHAYWDLTDISFSHSRILKEIIMGDIGGHSEFVSSVFFVDTQNCVLFHLYDDRGADVAAADQDILRPLYLKFTDWILDYDRNRIDRIFAGNGCDNGGAV